MAPRYRAALVIAALILFALGVWAHYASVQNAALPPTPVADVNSPLPMQTVAIQTPTGTTTITVEVASDDTEREAGLSNRTSLAVGHGMLFVFDPPRQVNFWMKEMNFSLDMIFADQNGVIVNIAQDATPASYPQTYPSAGAARYVIEVPAGYTEQTGIAVGAKIVVQ